MNNWFECKVKYQKIDENGKDKNVREAYLVDALSFTEAEARINKKLEEFISGEFNLTNISKSSLNEIFPFETGDKWFKVKIEFMAIDEAKGKEKKTSNLLLIQADDMMEALKNTEESLSTMIVPYDIKSIIESPIIDIFPYFEEEQTDKIPDNLRLLSDFEV